jgi:zinc protease
MMSKGVAAAGSAPAMDENALGEAWADLGAALSFNASNDRFSINLRSLTRTELLDGAVQLAARQLAHPSFPSAVWLSERQRWQASLAEAKTQPAYVAGRTFATAVYGTHPYGYDTTPAHLKAIEVRHLRAFHVRYLQTCQARVSVVGALNRIQAQARVTQLLAGLPQAKACATLPAMPEVQALARAQDIAIPFESAQAHVFIGQPGIARQSPDFLALTVGNYVLGGGGFVSRLTEQVREKRGLSYSVSSYFSPSMHAGAFRIALQTRANQASQAVQVARQVLADFVRDGPTEAEVQAAKDNLIGGFALRLDSNRKLLDNVSNIAWYDLPLDYLDTWSDKVQRLTAAEIQVAFARSLQPERMVTVVLGAKP